MLHSFLLRGEPGKRSRHPELIDTGTWAADRMTRLRMAAGN